MKLEGRAAGLEQDKAVSKHDPRALMGMGDTWEGIGEWGNALGGPVGHLITCLQ
jgi:hypothetical protein